MFEGEKNLTKYIEVVVDLAKFLLLTNGKVH